MLTLYTRNYIYIYIDLVVHIKLLKRKSLQNIFLLTFLFVHYLETQGVRRFSTRAITYIWSHLNPYKFRVCVSSTHATVSPYICLKPLSARCNIVTFLFPFFCNQKMQSSFVSLNEIKMPHLSFSLLLFYDFYLLYIVHICKMIARNCSRASFLALLDLAICSQQRVSQEFLASR